MTGDDGEGKDLLDAALRDEIELVSDLVVAASASDRHFTPDEVDALLGLSSRGAPAATGGAPDEPPPTAPEVTGG